MKRKSILFRTKQGDMINKVVKLVNKERKEANKEGRKFGVYSRNDFLEDAVSLKVSTYLPRLD